MQSLRGGRDRVGGPDVHSRKTAVTRHELVTPHHQLHAAVIDSQGDRPVLRERDRPRLLVSIAPERIRHLGFPFTGHAIDVGLRDQASSQFFLEHVVDRRFMHAGGDQIAGGGGRRQARRRELAGGGLAGGDGQRRIGRVHVEHFGIESLLFQRTTDLLLKLIAELPEGRLRLLLELFPEPIPGPAFSDGLGLRHGLGHLAIGDLLDQPLPEPRVDRHAGDGRISRGGSLHGRGAGGVFVEKEPTPGPETRHAAAADGDRPLRAAGVGDVGGGEHEIECGTIGRRHKIEPHVATGAAAPAHSGAQHDLVDRHHLIDGTIHGLGEQALVHFKEDVRPGIGTTDGGHDIGGLACLRKPLENRRHRREAFGTARRGGRQQRRRQRTEPLAHAVGAVAASGISHFGIPGDRLPRPHKFGHVETGLGGVQEFFQPSQRGGVGGHSRGGLRLKGGPVEVGPPGRPALAAIEERVERHEGLP